ncbi:MAG TPA: outer membrane beta-barrel protein, partial [Vicinamibacterales bacterium]|nr:outer membrane beta-barrel protein [Vicinamibacterales bacterium]
MRRVLITVVVAFGLAAQARAQTAWTDRGYFDLSADVRVSPMTFDGIARPIDFAEAATVSTSYDVKQAPGFDVAAGVRVWRNLAIGVDVAWSTRPSTGSITAQMPHPLFFNRPRSVSGDASGLDHDETALHVQAVWMIPATPRWSIALAGGPSWIVVNQAIVDDVAVTSTYPFDTASFANAVSGRTSAGRLGFNVGGDVAYRVRRRAGIGFGVRFARARVPMTSAAGNSITVDAGGLGVDGG